MSGGAVSVSAVSALSECPPRQRPLTASPPPSAAAQVSPRRRRVLLRPGPAPGHRLHAPGDAAVQHAAALPDPGRCTGASVHARAVSLSCMQSLVLQSLAGVSLLRSVSVAPCLRSSHAAPPLLLSSSLRPGPTGRRDATTRTFGLVPALQRLSNGSLSLAPSLAASPPRPPRPSPAA